MLLALQPPLRSFSSDPLGDGAVSRNAIRHGKRQNRFREIDLAVPQEGIPLINEVEQRADDERDTVLGERVVLKCRRRPLLVCLARGGCMGQFSGARPGTAIHPRRGTPRRPASLERS